ncbi:MAG: hybrid sensor histidine kinase/response regulator [Deltaproteobacteria bacterium]|nr:hybrid sensor histidine kinase/response regulator [Deltaproteobacteria bacterium]
MPRVLHIEDDEGSRALVRRVLSAAGWEVVDAVTGLSGIRQAMAANPDVILVDIQLPDMDGYEVTLKLRGELRGREVPIVAITGAGDRDMSLAVGCDGHIRKPIDVNRFADKLASFLSGRHERRAFGAENLLLAQGQKLAAKLQEKIEELEQTNRRLVESEKVRAEFYRNLSHELSTPLTPAIGYLNMLRSGDMGFLSPMQLRAIESVERSFQRMRAVIENILDMTALATGQMTFIARHYDFNQIAREAVDLCGHRFDERDIEMETVVPDAPFKAYGDSDKLKRAMVQLLENAVKFCPSGGKVHVASRRSGGQLTFLVYDSGQGIPEQELEAIFKTFYQVDGSPTREHGGAGLGLALARKIVERFGGDVWAESPPQGESGRFSWARTLVALRVPEIMAGETPPGQRR